MTGAVRFRLIETLGRPDVYLAEVEGGSGPPVVLKLTSISGSFAEAQAQVRQQAAILERLAHPSVVFVRDLVEHTQRSAALSDYVPGADVEHVLAALELVGETLPPRAALAVGGGILTAVAGAVRATDAAGRPHPIVHGALRPSAVHLTVRGGVRVADYNFPKSGLSGSTTLHERYLAPERMLGGAPSVAGDVYSAAAIVAELLTGRTMAASLVPDRQELAVEGLLAPLYERWFGSPPITRALGTLARALDTQGRVRPDPIELQEALDGGAAAMQGETLPTFAGRFLPELDAILGRMSAPASGVMGGPPALQSPPSSTPTRRRGLPAIVVVATAAISAVGAAITTWLLVDP